MATPVQDVYDAFLSMILEDEWAYWTEEEVKSDMALLLNKAISWFKFPRNSLEISSIDGNYFEDELDKQEIQILATYMKCEWLNRSIMTWENVKPLYEEKDFSQANLLDKLTSTLEKEKKTAEKLEALYYRSRDKKPFNFSLLAGEH